MFRLFSNGYKTSRDAYIYNFSWYACAEHARMMVDDYLGALAVLEEHPEYTVDDAANRHSSHVRWDRELKNNLRRKRKVSYSGERIRKSQYRPFVRQFCYVDYVLVNNKYQQDSIFPSPDIDNHAICVPATGSRRPFAALMVDVMPDLHLVEDACQCFPRYRFEPLRDAAGAQGDLLDPAAGLARIDNITDTALRAFRVRYSDNTITKDAIFDYVYGILHAPAYRERFANDLAKELPRIPLAPEFNAFAVAGSRLARLHLDYESGEEWPLEVVFAQPGEPAPEHCQVGERAMRFADDDRSVLIVNDHLRLAGIPARAHDYQVNGRTPIEWFIDRYRITRDRDSGILNDPNGWFENPCDLIAAFRRIVQVSVETVAVVESLPCPFSEPEAQPNGERL
ncbi:MAG: hypothetical protein OXI15_04025 [Chromatiales bacterium]|nr:hypothetical protein [Chromatiales bacterium]